MTRIACALLASTTLAVTLLAKPAVAQEAAAPQSTANNDRVDDIVVTAQKREEKVQDVPIAVSVVTGDALKAQNISNVQQLQYMVPELETPGGHFAIRGIGTNTYTRSAESDVSIVVDGVVQGQLNPPQGGLFDLQRVEILSGPQGMLFGKNASAGVVNIVTNAPVLDKFELSGHADIATRSYRIFQGILNVPVGKTSALRLAAFHNGYDGFINNRFDGQRFGGTNDNGARLRFRWEPNSNLTVNLIGDYEKQQGASMPTSRQLTGALAPRILGCGVAPGPDNLDTCIDGRALGGFEDYGLNLQLDWRLGDYTITSITADRQHRDHANGDTDGSPTNVLNVNGGTDFNNQFSQELRVASPSAGRVQYVAGLYFWRYAYRGDSDQAGGIGVLPPPLQADRSSSARVNQTSYAVFGQATVGLIDGLKLIIGGRATRDELKSSTVNFVNNAVGIYVPGFSVPGTDSGKSLSSSGSVATNNLSYKIGLQYAPARNTMMYVTYARGYKGPAINNVSPGLVGQTIVDPEIPLDWEAGVKTSLFSNRLIVNLALFSETIKDFQAQVFGVQAGVAQFTFANASHLFAKGVQLSVSSRPAAGLTLNGSVLYNHATYDHFIVQCDAGYLVGCVPQNGLPVTDVKGLQLAGAPRWKLTFAADYRHPVTNKLEAFVAVDGSYRDDVRTLAAPDPNIVIGGYALVNGRIGLESRDNRYRLALFAKNLFNKRRPAAIYPDPILPVAGNYAQSFTMDSFRVIGVSIDARF